MRKYRMMLVYIVIAMICQVTSDQTFIGTLGGGTNETVEYVSVISSRITEPMDVQFTFFGVATNTSTETVTVYPYMVSEVTVLVKGNTTTGTQITKKSAEVRSFENTLYIRVFVTRKNYTEGFLPLTKPMLGLEYYVSTFCEFGGFCQFSVTALNAVETRVHIKIPDSVSEIVFCVGETKFRSHRNTDFTLSSNEVLFVESPHDLTGTHIMADRTVVVLAGSRDMVINGTIVHLIDQLLPVSQWGKSFIISSTHVNQYDTIQITSGANNTRIEMGGFPSIVMPIPGMTIKRRLEYGMNSTITSNYPIQVVQVSGLPYSSTNITAGLGVVSAITSATTVALGMSVVPSVELFDIEYYATCGLKKTSASVRMFSTSSIDIYRFAGSTISLTETSAAPVPYSSYRVYETNEFESEHVSRIESVLHDTFGGILRCGDTGAIMPLGFVPRSCIASLTSPTYSDGVDNDCDGQTDEDYCFENKMVTTHFSIQSSTTLDFHTENITDASIIKLRIKTCGTSTVQLRTDDGGTYLLRLSQAFLVGYSCFPYCNESQTVDTKTYYQYFSNCTNEIAFYWIRIMDDEVCAGLGPIPYGNCVSAELSANMTGNLTLMKVGGLMQDATLWIECLRSTEVSGRHITKTGQDVTRSDCGNTETGTPDGHGRKFVVTSPGEAVETLITIRNATSATFHDVAYSAPDQILQKINSQEDDDGGIYTLTVKLNEQQKLAMIVTDADAVVTVLYRTSSPALEKTFVVYPLDTCGTEYLVNIPGESGYCDIVAIEADTVLETSMSNGPTTQESLEPGSVLTKLVSMDDGVVFRANRPFVLFCGGVTDGWNQMYPKYSLGTHYIIPDIDTISSLQIQTAVKVVATQDNTRIEFGALENTIMLNRGERTSIVYESTESYNITSNVPVSVGLLVTDTYNYMSDFTLLPAVDNFMDDALVLGDMNSFIITVDSSGHEELIGLKDVDYTIPQNKTFALTIFLAFSNWVGGTSLMVYQTPSVVFSNLEDEYTCRLTEGEIGDNIDNDCDGQIDEDICYPEYGAVREDLDFDGGYGEDCYEEITGVSDVLPPEEPYCGGSTSEAPATQLPTVSNTPEGPLENCLKPCRCPCSWMQQMEYRMSLSPEEIDALNEAIIKEYQEDMRLDENHLSSNLAKKQSATDDRPSSSGIGCVGIVFAGGVLLLIVAVDAVTFFSYLFGRFNRV